MSACVQSDPGYSHMDNTVISGIRVVAGLGSEPKGKLEVNSSAQYISQPIAMMNIFGDTTFDNPS